MIEYTLQTSLRLRKVECKGVALALETSFQYKDLGDFDKGSNANANEKHQRIVSFATALGKNLVDVIKRPRKVCHTLSASRH